jgi:hypothetical protein
VVELLELFLSLKLLFYHSACTIPPDVDDQTTPGSLVRRMLVLN